jgi:hypothetical protein
VGSGMLQVMSESPAERPLCECHGVPKIKNGMSGGVQQYRCAVKNRARCAIANEMYGAAYFARLCGERYERKREEILAQQAEYRRGQGYVTTRRRLLGLQRERIIEQMETLNGSD